MVDAEERGGGAGYKDADLVDGIVGRVERTVMGEGSLVERIEEGW